MSPDKGVWQLLISSTLNLVGALNCFTAHDLGSETPDFELNHLYWFIPLTPASSHTCHLSASKPSAI